MELKIGEFLLVVLDRFVSDENIIEEPRYKKDETLFKDENIILLIKDKILESIELREAPFASWLLARLWHLTNGEIEKGLNLYDKNIGCQDGGWYYCQFSVQNLDNKTLATLYLEACSWYENIFIQECSESIEPLEIIELIEDILLTQPNDLAVCSIAIENPEENGKLYFYGWDGYSFLGKITY